MDDIEVLPCGCVLSSIMYEGEQVFQIAPCRLTCKYYLYTVEECKRQNKPIEYRMQ